MAGRLWTTEEQATLRACYGKVPTVELAQRLSRTVKAIQQQAKKYQLVKLNVRVTDEQVRQLHAAGKCDTDIALALGSERHVIGRRRKRLGLPPIPKDDRSIKAQRRTLGITSAGQLRPLAWAIRAVRRGWPIDLGPRHIDILEAFEAHGPMTRREICAAIGANWIGSRASLKCRGEGGSYLAQLMNRGLVVSLGKVVKGQGKGFSQSLYTLALTTERTQRSPDCG